MNWTSEKDGLLVDALGGGSGVPAGSDLQFETASPVAAGHGPIFWPEAPRVPASHFVLDVVLALAGPKWGRRRL